MDILIGTSGWQYDDWRGVLYPDGIAKKDWLGHFSERFPIVEVNNTFYNLPAEDTFVKWRTGSAEDFTFVIKASRYITHIKRLKDCREPVGRLWSRVGRLGRKLGPVLYQLPPNLRADHGLLEGFLGLLPKHQEAAFEFRHDSWLDERTLELLDDAGCAFVLADGPGARVPDLVTGGWTYLRFHKGREDHFGYTRRKLRRWADRIAGLDAARAFVFFNNDPGGAAVRDARTLTDLLRDRSGHRVLGP